MRDRITLLLVMEKWLKLIVKGLKEMKTPKLTTLFVITAIAVNIVFTLCGILVWICDDMLPTSKYSFTCIILGAVGVSAYFFLNLFQTNTEENEIEIKTK